MVVVVMVVKLPGPLRSSLVVGEPFAANSTNNPLCRLYPVSPALPSGCFRFYWVLFCCCCCSFCFSSFLPPFYALRTFHFIFKLQRISS
uniref:Uncharacterized protein n=1 Tax=Anopheles darlingi TaxID=43151 RepID=A0A2M4D1D1_ANODA